MNFNVLLNNKAHTISREQLESVLAAHLPLWAVSTTLNHMIDTYTNSDEGARIRLDDLTSSHPPYEVIDYDEAVYRCSSMIEDEDEDEDEIIDTIEEWLEGYLDTNESAYGYEFLVFNH